MLVVLAAVVSMAGLAFAAVASASGTQPGSTYSTGFEPSEGFTTLGTINGQGTAPATWSSRLSQEQGSPPFDQAVTNVNPITGSQSFRMSNSVADGAFGDQTHAPMLADGASEGGPNHVFDARFTIKSVTADYQPNLRVSVSPDDGVGARMAYVRFDDEPDGIHVFVVDNPANADQRQVEWGTVLSRTTAHTVRIWIKFVPGVNDDGTGNDIVRVIVDGHDVGDETHTCFTSWEQWYRFGEMRDPPVTNSLTFMARTAYDENDNPLPDGPVGGGYLFDDVSYTASDGPGPIRGNCGIDVDKTTQTRTAEPGQLIPYRITVRNRSKLPARGLIACDRPPRALTFLRATPRLHRLAGGRLCLTIPVLGPGQRFSLRAIFRLGANVPAGTVINDGTVDIPNIPNGSVPSPELPNGSPPTPGAPPIPPSREGRRIIKVKAAVKVRAKAHRRPKPSPPTFTG
jgi:uncharacterized repeat protein (TIGR01451 family)